MIRIIAILMTMLFLTGCSTVESREYFSPNVDQQHKSGPETPFCGWANFGGFPDSYVITHGNNKVTVTANQNFHPYLWGPWFASVIPIFPITWITELFVSDDLDITVLIEGKNVTEKWVSSFSISTPGNDNFVVKPSRVKMNVYGENRWVYVKFPIDYGSIEKFVLHVNSSVEEIDSFDVPFIKAHRWSWTQWTPNC